MTPKPEVSRQFDHRLNHIARAREHETNLVILADDFPGGLQEIFRPLLHRHPPEKQHDLFVLRNRRQRWRGLFGHLDGVVDHLDLLRRHPVPCVDNLRRHATDANDPRRGSHACTLDVIDRLVDVFARAVKFGTVNMHDQGLARRRRHRQPRGESHPVVGMNHFERFLQRQLHRQRRVALNLFHQVAFVLRTSATLDNRIRRASRHERGGRFFSHGRFFGRGGQRFVNLLLHRRGQCLHRRRLSAAGIFGDGLPQHHPRRLSAGFTTHLHQINALLGRGRAIRLQCCRETMNLHVRKAIDDRIKSLFGLRYRGGRFQRIAQREHTLRRAQRNVRRRLLPALFNRNRRGQHKTDFDPHFIQPARKPVASGAQPAGDVGRKFPA